MSGLHNISFTPTGGLRIAKEGDSSDDEEDDDGMLGASLGSIAPNNQFQGFLFEQILKVPMANNANGNQNGHNKYMIGMIDDPYDF